MNMRATLLKLLKFTNTYHVAKKIQNKYNLVIGEGHGHSLLLKLLRKKKKFNIKGLNFLEIGSSRESIFGQGSTSLIANYCEKNKINFISVDADSKNVKKNKKNMKKFKYFNIIKETGENFSKKNKVKFDVIYLDAFDIETSNPPSVERVKFYKDKFNKKITNTTSAKMHCEVIISLLNNLSEDCLIVFDDTFIVNKKILGKGKTAIPILLENKFSIINKNKNSVALERSLNE